MNESAPSKDRSQSLPTPPIRNSSGPSARWFTHLVRCNPFYLLSALLLIYGLYRVSIDPHFLRTDTGQILFNFGAIEVYEAMLAATALVLVRRRITYDSQLLFWLENLLIVIPF